jgi:hypothetical protein
MKFVLVAALTVTLSIAAYAQEFRGTRGFMSSRRQYLSHDPVPKPLDTIACRTASVPGKIQAGCFLREQRAEAWPPSIHLKRVG